VVTGVYCRVRNPMISGVVAILIGEALLFRSLALLAWAGVVWTLNAIYIPLVEEHGLAQRFGDEYHQYKQHVPRWLPRRTPWTPPWA
jgi:protein-S-isoprenylcysteine O-methyltransferase Ste14